MDFYSCESLVDLNPIEVALSGLISLEKLSIGFYNCEVLSSIEPLTTGLGHLRSLCKLVLDFNYCYSLVDLAPLSTALSQLSQLKAICLRIHGNEEMNDLGPLERLHMPGLEKFELQLNYCSLVTCSLHTLPALECMRNQKVSAPADEQSLGS